MICLLSCAVALPLQTIQSWQSCTRSTRIKVGFTVMSLRSSLCQLQLLLNPCICLVFFVINNLVSDFRGLEILAFPCNQFNGQEPGSNEEIENFVCTRFKAEYPIFSKVRMLVHVLILNCSMLELFCLRNLCGFSIIQVDVNGSDAAPLYKYLKSVKGDEIEWNFAKFLVDKDGKLVERYAPTTTPLTFEVTITCMSLHKLIILWLTYDHFDFCRMISRKFQESLDNRD